MTAPIDTAELRRLLAEAAEHYQKINPRAVDVGCTAVEDIASEVRNRLSGAYVELAAAAVMQLEPLLDRLSELEELAKALDDAGISRCEHKTFSCRYCHNDE